ncbi:MAG TPA: hypothetical protein VK915_07810 [Gaiellaceae bacterium]|nr:hypothetical protein [Gaiellaceae bacterium]
MSRVAELLPDADVVTRHETTIGLPPGEALAVVLGTSAAADRLTALLLRLRGLPSGRTIADVLPELERSETEAVFGLAGKPWLPLGALGDFHEPGPGTVRIAAGFRAEPAPRRLARGHGDPGRARGRTGAEGVSAVLEGCRAVLGLRPAALAGGCGAAGGEL